MIGALWNGYTGLNMNDKAIAVESNNATNTTTVASKLDQVSFSDMFYIGNYGKGTQIETISKVFTQGELQQTGVNYDIALEGKGFFVTRENSTENIDNNNPEFFYSRAGNFKKIFSANTADPNNPNAILGTQDNMAVLGLVPNDQNLVYFATNTDAVNTGFTTDYTNFVTSSDIVGNNYFAVVDQNPDPNIYDPIIDDTIEYNEDNQANPDISFYVQNSTITNMNVKTTDYTQTAQNDDILNSGSNYKTASSKLNDIELLQTDFINKVSLYQTNPNADSVASTTQISQIDYSSLLGELQNENDYLTLNIDGTIYRQNFTNSVEETLNSFSDQISNTQGYNSSIDTTTGVMTVEKIVAGDEFNIIGANINEQYIQTSTIQEATLGSGAAMLDVARQAYKNAVESVGGEYLEINTVLVTDNKYEKALSESGVPLSSEILSLDEISISLKYQNLVEGVEGNLEVSNDGLVYLVDDNAKFLVGKLQTAGFSNEQGLNPIGTNTFKATQESGGPFNADALNNVVSTFLERANTSYSNTLSTLLVYQKAFEANSKSVTISDEFVKTAIDMKK